MYNASEMKLAAHSDASYLSKPKARSRAGCHFFLSNNAEIPANNGAILNIAHIIKHVMSSASEAELAALYIMARESVYIRIILEEMGHKQPPTSLQTNNSMAAGVVNGQNSTDTNESHGHAIPLAEGPRMSGTIPYILETRQTNLRRLLD